MNRATTLALCLSFSTVAVADDREMMESSTDRETDEREIDDLGTTASTAGADIWPPPFTFPFPKPGAPADDLGSDAIQIEFLGSGKVARNTQAYDFDVDGDAYTVEYRNSPRFSRLSLYDDEGEVVVGYVTSERGAVIFDDEGIVERGSPGDIDISAIQDYGVTATLLTNPVFLGSFLEANGETFEGDDDPPGYWWVPAALLVARCAEISVTYDASGWWSVSAGWDC